MWSPRIVSTINYDIKMQLQVGLHYVRSSGFIISHIQSEFKLVYLFLFSKRSGTNMVRNLAILS